MAERVRILFIGEIHSSHARGWISLLSSHSHSLDVRAVHLHPQVVPEVPFRLYWAANLREMSLAREDAAYPLDEQRQLWDLIAASGCSLSPSAMLKSRATVLHALRDFRPTLVHTFGFDPSALLYALVPPRARQLSRWVLQTRGGSDVAFTRFRPNWQQLFKLVLPQADAVVCDNEENYRVFADLGVQVRRSGLLPIASGSGGIDTAAFSTPAPIGQRERLLVWNKAYESRWSKALPVLEAIRIAFPQISPVRIVLTAVHPEVRDWIPLLPGEMQSSVELRERISHDEMLDLIQRARVVLSPSLVDGIPNTLYETMAAGAIPIVSPLATLTPHFREGENVFYARNLYPEEISKALVKAFSADGLEAMVRRNLAKVRAMADRSVIQQGTIGLYLALAGSCAASPAGQHERMAKVPAGRIPALLWRVLKCWIRRARGSGSRRF